MASSRLFQREVFVSGVRRSSLFLLAAQNEKKKNGADRAPTQKDSSCDMPTANGESGRKNKQINKHKLIFKHKTTTITGFQQKKREEQKQYPCLKQNQKQRLYPTKQKKYTPLSFAHKKAKYNIFCNNKLLRVRIDRKFYARCLRKGDTTTTGLGPGRRYAGARAFRTALARWRASLYRFPLGSRLRKRSARRAETIGVQYRYARVRDARGGEPAQGGGGKALHGEPISRRAYQ